MTEHSTGPGSPYDGLLEEHDDSRWAYGTGFDDPLTGVDTSLPDGVDGAALAAYCLMLGDDALVLCQRLTQWVTRAPELEEEVALANVALDLLGQARLLYARAAAADPTIVPPLPAGSPVPPEDALAYFRDGSEFRNVWLAELDNGDFAVSSVRLMVFATWRLALLERLRASRDPVLAAVAAKGVKEVTYHRDYAARWVVTLAQGTAESRARARSALDTVWPHLPELFRPHPVEARLPGVAVDSADVRVEFDDVLAQVFAGADLRPPERPDDSADVHDDLAERGRAGVHTATFRPLIGELQELARAHPEALW